MITRRIIKYEILVEYHKSYGNLPIELIARKTDFCYSLEAAVETAMRICKEINTSKKKLIRAAGYDDNQGSRGELKIFCGRQIRKDAQEALNKGLEESDCVHMTFNYADNKLVDLIINKTKHNHHYA